MRPKFAEKTPSILTAFLSMLPLCLMIGILLQVFYIDAREHITPPPCRPFIDESKWVCDTCGEINPVEYLWCKHCGYHKDRKPVPYHIPEQDNTRIWEDEDTW